MSSKYLVIHMSDPTGTELPRSEDQAMLERWAAEGEHADRLTLGGPVAGPERAKSVAVRDGRTLVTDGPFPEFKEWFAGYDLITADSIDEAAEYMAKHPVAVLGRIYILPMVTLPWEQE
ncbi:YciI family protein [Agromyces soli]|uniref:YciI family protein n=1 Tax=Agromyces soli TaxID=659012 RepID=A0ABY4AV54_9MICO|nr:YciI family protein [Agromyces soli]UOE24750.1 YciI family protein [Agromyces soli]